MRSPWGGASVTANVFSHSGDLGDLLAALPTVKALGGGVFTSSRPTARAAE